jgi:hypothetical protein
MTNIEYPEIGVCGLSCRLCPSYHSKGESRCGGCKSEYRMRAGCPFITCAVKKKGIEFCWQCTYHMTCDKWRRHREHGRTYDSFVCYQRLDDNIAHIECLGITKFERDQKVRQELLSEMLAEFNEGRSKSFYCIAATVLDTGEIKEAMAQARDEAVSSDIKEKSNILHTIILRIAEEKKYILRLRKKSA